MFKKIFGVFFVFALLLVSTFGITGAEQASAAEYPYLTIRPGGDIYVNTGETGSFSVRFYTSSTSYQDVTDYSTYKLNNLSDPPLFTVGPGVIYPTWDTTDGGAHSFSAFYTDPRTGITYTAKKYVWVNY